MEESGDDVGDFFVRKDTGVGQAGVVIDGDVERFAASAFIAIRFRSPDTVRRSVAKSVCLRAANSAPPG